LTASQRRTICVKLFTAVRASLLDHLAQRLACPWKPSASASTSLAALGGSFRRETLPQERFDVIQHAQTAAHTGRSSRGQHVIRTRGVVPGGLGREFIQKNRACILNGWGQRGRQREMLGCDAVRCLDRLIERSNQKYGSATRKRFSGNRICPSAPLNFCLDSFCHANL
jgi:hypothetical protein